MRVVVDGASVRFGERAVFSDFSVGFGSHEVSALVGPSGSGKTTLLAAIASEHRLWAGSVWFDTGDGARMPVRPEDVTWVPQNGVVLGARSVLDNVLIAPLSSGMNFGDARSIAVAALGRVGLEDRMDASARSLSGGEVQRVSFARSLASGKPVILADEPSASLDEENTRTIAMLLRELADEATIIVATHDPLLIAAAQHAYYLRAESYAEG